MPPLVPAMPSMPPWPTTTDTTHATRATVTTRATAATRPAATAIPGKPPLPALMPPMPHGQPPLVPLVALMSSVPPMPPIPGHWPGVAILVGPVVFMLAAETEKVVPRSNKSAHSPLTAMRQIAFAEIDESFTAFLLYLYPEPGLQALRGESRRNQAMPAWPLQL